MIPVAEICTQSLGCVRQDAAILTLCDHIRLLLTYSMILHVQLRLKPVEVVLG